MKPFYRVLFALLVVSPPCLSQTIAITEEGKSALGTHDWILGSMGGKPHLEQVVQVINVGDIPPTPEPQPPGGSDVEKKVALWARAVNEPQMAMALSATADVIAKKIADKSIPVTSAWQAWSLSSTLALTQADKDWDDFLDQMADLYKSKIGSFTTVAEYAKFFQDASNGLAKAGGDEVSQAALTAGTAVLLGGGSLDEALKAAAAAAATKSNIDWPALFEIIMQIIELIIRLFPPGG